jgi:heme/copper-type cytochrome/quinol oxidase subunit 3
LELEPRLIFSLLAGGPLILIVGMGIVGAAALYLLEREARRAQARSLGGTPAAQSPQPAPVAQPLRLAPISQKLAATGVAEAAPTMGVPSNKLGMWVFLASEIMFFTALIATYIGFRVRGTLIPPAELDVPLAALNTFILIVSSFTVVLALDAIRADRQNRFVLLLLATLALGSVFVGIQGIEWNELLGHSITPTSQLFGTAFFVMTGFHGLHVIIGLLWLVFALLKAFRGDFSRDRYMGFEIFGLYWHFVDIVWIVLFTLIYLM